MTSNTDRDSASYQLDISKKQAAELNKTGSSSAGKRGHIFNDEQNSTFANPTERNLMESAGRASEKRRIHATEQIANEYTTK
ncbi:hypothetical protein N7457_005424 [Penicillium paradoxum]|uniref:uncharacterized protein n=1 Tax=Penicillium paradoxum TaxID=176176 RepID=UPI002547E706|nr:uncharacterized protein N7457_005424 [Penicillium paradoxum]KAJ5780264.1 hypothetical protein N7457_005424 [Penicillium paradoxum]